MTELRCPVNPSRLFAKVASPHIVDGNLIEVACRDCRRRHPGVRSVLHRYTVLGELVESEVVRHDGGRDVVSAA